MARPSTVSARGPRPRWVAIAFVLSAGCGSGGGGGGPGNESVARVQQSLAVQEFEAQVQADPALSSAYDLATAYTGASGFQWAGVLEDDNGVTMIYGELDDGTDDPAVLVRHCRVGDCVSAVQFYTGDDDEIAWTTVDGDIPVRTARMPFLLRLIDESDPDGSAAIAPAGLDVDSLASGVVRSALGKADEPTDPNRKLHLASAFGKWFTLQGPNLDDLKTSMKSGGFPQAQSIYHVNESEVDRSLSTLGPSDAFVWLTHGDLSKSKGKVVGMTVARGYWGSKHYPAGRMTQQLAKNGSGGPGIVILAGCMTQDLIPAFDNGQRVVLGFKGKVMPGAAATAVKAFFDRLAKGGTVQEALDAANAQITDPSVQLVANPGANLTQKLVDVGTPGDTCSADFAGSWEGTLTVTSGSDKLPVETSATYSCGKFTLGMGDGTYGTCKGCWVSGTFVSRAMAGCAKGSNVTLSSQDGGTESVMDVDLVNKTTMTVTNWAKDTAGADITRDGTFTRCE